MEHLQRLQPAHRQELKQSKIQDVKTVRELLGSSKSISGKNMDHPVIQNLVVFRKASVNPDPADMLVVKNNCGDSVCSGKSLRCVSLVTARDVAVGHRLKNTSKSSNKSFQALIPFMCMSAQCD